MAKRNTTPKLDANGKELRTIEMSFRLTPSEIGKLESAAKDAGMCIADYIRWMTIGPKSIRKIPHKTEIVQIRGNLGKIGENINMISRNLNTSAKKYGVADLSDIAENVPELACQLPELSEQIASLKRKMKHL